jgi:hypothetical protein
LTINGITVDVPSVTTANSLAAVQVTISLAATTLSSVPSATYTCPGGLSATTTVSVSLAATTQTESGILNMKNGQLALSNPVFAVNADITIPVGATTETVSPQFLIPLPAMLSVTI